MKEDTESLESKLVRDLWINPNQYLKAKAEQKNTGCSLYSILVKSGYLGEEEVYSFFSQHTGIPFVDIFEYLPDEALLNLFPVKLYREYLFFPLYAVKKTLYIAMENPLNTELANILGMHTDFEIYPVFASVSSLKKAIDSFWGPEDKYFNSLEELVVSPQPLHEIPFWRESERRSLNLPVEVRPGDSCLPLVSSVYIPATATDISRSGKALGISLGKFIPVETGIFVKFPSKDSLYEARAEVARCVVDRKAKNRFLLGVRFVELKEDLLKQLLDSSQPSQY